jgi:hypothetical protein
MVETGSVDKEGINGTMDYGVLIRRTWDLIWSNKWLILLGILVALGSGQDYSSRSRFNFGDHNGEEQRFDGFDFNRDGEPGGEMPDIEGLEQDFGDLGQALPWLGLGAAVIIPLLCLGAIIGIALWAVATIARGGLIAGADVLDGGGTSSFSLAWRAGWEKGWRLIGIRLLPAIPALVLGIVIAGLAGASFGLRDLGPRSLAAAGAGLGITAAAIVCVAALAALVLGLLSTFAERACMLENEDVFGSYGRGWAVLRDNLGPAVIIFLIQIALSLAIGLAMLIVSPLLCCLCVAGLLISLGVNGTIAAYFSTLWTLAWRQWTGRAPAMAAAGEPPAPVAPAVEAPPAPVEPVEPVSGEPPAEEPPTE